VQDTGDVVYFFENNRIEKGDTLKLLTETGNKGTLVLIIAVVVMLLLRYIFTHANKLKNQKDGEQLLDELFKGKSIEEIEQQVVEEYGIKIEVEVRRKKEENSWHTLSMQSLEKAYEVNEPDYNDVQVQEPNPDYKPWKKEQ